MTNYPAIIGEDVTSVVERIVELRAEDVLLTDNLTANRSFRNFFAPAITEVTAAYLFGLNDFHVSADATSGAFSVTLDPNPKAGVVAVISKTDVSANAVTVDAGSGETINGVQTQSLASQYDKIMIQYLPLEDEWRIISS